MDRKMVNLSKLQEIDTLQISVNLSDPEILNTAVETSNSTTDGFFGLIIGIAIYIVLVYLATRQDSLFSLDLPKSSVLGSGVSLIILIILLSLNMISSFIHLMLFAFIFIVSLVITYLLREKE